MNNVDQESSVLNEFQFLMYDVLFGEKLTIDFALSLYIYICIEIDK